MKYKTFNSNNALGLKFTFELVSISGEDQPSIVEISNGETVLTSFFLTTIFKHEPELGLYFGDGIVGWHLTSEQFAELRAFLVTALAVKGISVEEHWEKYASKLYKEKETLYI